MTNRRVRVVVLCEGLQDADLDGHEVDGTLAYPKLPRQRDCQRHVNELSAMCGRELRQPAPPSLQAACDEFRTRVLES
jgi:hypothetical protein